MNNHTDSLMTVNAIRTLAIDAIDAANSGHPGAPLGQAPMLETLFHNHINLNPQDPLWLNRDRFVLSSGHASAGLYATLALYTDGLTFQDLSKFRQWQSKTPGHPEFGHTRFVDSTSGPLGQGIAIATGMALAESHLAAMYNTTEHQIIDHYTYAICGDGCLMEGVSSEASSLAGTMGLGKLILLYDDNGITIEGNTNVAFTENVKLRYQSYGWQVLEVNDGNDMEAINTAIIEAKNDKNRPSIIICKTVIGYASPVAGMSKAHGSPLGATGNAETKKELGWPEKQAPFTVPESVSTHCAKRNAEWQNNYATYLKMYEAWQNQNPELAKQLSQSLNPMSSLELVGDDFPEVLQSAKASRQHSGECLNHLGKKLPWLFGGSADLAPSNNSDLKGEGFYSQTTPEARNIHYGVREFGMAAMSNGLALHGGVLPYVATFFVFSDYLKAAIRLSALMKLQVIYVLTHDSIGVGEDGPTHQPIEQLAMLRSIPGLLTFRPADGPETIAAYKAALSYNGPTAIILSRQTLPLLPTNVELATAKGGYTLKTANNPELVLVSSGSEVSLALEVSSLLEAEGILANVVSMPCHEIFRKQDDAYKASVLPPTLTKRIAIEAAASQPWHEWTGLGGMLFTLDRFGDSAPADTLYQAYGLSAKAICDKIKQHYSL